MTSADTAPATSPGMEPPGSGVSLADFTTLGLGGPAARLVQGRNEAEIVAAVRAADAVAGPVLVLGGGSNVVIADAGFPGTVVRIASEGIEAKPIPTGRRLTVAAGQSWARLVDIAVERHLSGIECLAGIPGTVGAAPVQNIGAYGQEVADTITAVRVLDRTDGHVRDLAARACGFGYRASVFKAGDRYVVLSVTFDLVAANESRPVRYTELADRLEVPVGAGAPLAAVRDAVLALRRGKGMVLDPNDPDTRSAGSFFTNPVLGGDQAAALPAQTPRFALPDARVKVPAAWLIEAAGIERGQSVGSARVSSKHTLALTAAPGGSTADLLALARLIRAAVEDRFGVCLVPEPVLVGCAL